LKDKEKFKKEGAISTTTKLKEKESSSGIDLRINSLQKKGYDRKLSSDPIQSIKIRIQMR